MVEVSFKNPKMLSLGDIEKEKPNELLQQVYTDNERASIL